MPKLVAESMEIPSLSSLTSPAADNPQQPKIGPDGLEEGPGEGWSQVPAKQTRTSSPVINPYAKTMAPFKIPIGSLSPRTIDVETKLRLPTSIRINPPKNVQVKFHLSRILAAILQGVQGVTATASLGPILQSDNDLPRINNINQIPEDAELILKYIESPRSTKNGSFYANIVINSDYEIHELKKDEAFRLWISNERLHLEYYPLRASTPMNVGFLYKINPRDDTLNLQCSRLRKMLPPGSPAFHLIKQPLYTGKAKTMVLVIKADEPDVPRLAQLMNAVNATRADIEYYPWEDYLALNRLQRLHIINLQNAFTSKFRTLVISGFIDDEDDIPLMYIEEHSEAMQEDDRVTSPYETMGVTKFLRTVPKSGKGSLLFAYVFPPIFGTREVIISHDNASEAMSYVRVAHGELAREMNQGAIDLIFKDPLAAVEAAALEPWIPFQRTREIPEAIATVFDNTNKVMNKRLRSSDGNQGNKKSYANIVLGNRSFDHASKEKTMSSTASINTRSDQTEITNITKIEGLEKSNELILQRFIALEKNLIDISAVSNQSTVEQMVRHQVQGQVAEIETKITAIVEAKLVEHSTGIDKKLDGIVAFFTEKYDHEAEREQRRYEANEKFLAEDSQFKAQMTNYFANVTRLPPLEGLPITPDHVGSNLMCDRQNTVSYQDNHQQQGTESPHSGRTIAIQLQLKDASGGRNSPISIDTDSCDDSSIAAMI